MVGECVVKHLRVLCAFAVAPFHRKGAKSAKRYTELDSFTLFDVFIVNKRPNYH